MLYLIFTILVILPRQNYFDNISISKFINNKICYQNNIKFFACYFSINALLNLKNYSIIPKRLINNKHDLVFKELSNARSFSLIKKTDDSNDDLNSILKELNSIYFQYFKNHKKLDYILPIDFENFLNIHIQYIHDTINNNPEILSSILELEDIESFTNYLDNLNINFNTYLSIHIVNKFLETIHPYNKLSIEQTSIEDYYQYRPGFDLSYDASSKRLKVVKVYENTDAFNKGIKEGMLLNSVNSCFIFDVAIFDIYAQGNFNTTYNFSFIKPHHNVNINLDKKVTATNYKFLNQLNLSTYNLINEPKNIFSLYDDPILYIKINYFFEDYTDSFKQNLDEINKNINELKPKAIILDLRNSQGGNISYARKFLELFFNRGTLLFIQNINLNEDYLEGKTDIYKGKIDVFSLSDGEVNLPMTILTNELTASAAEIISGVFKELRGATIIGSNPFTFGKSISYQIFDFEDVYIYNKISEIILPISRSSFEYIGIKSDFYIKNNFYKPECFLVSRMKDLDTVFKYRELNINLRKETRGIKTYTYSFPVETNNKIIYDYQYYFAKNYLLDSLNKLKLQ